MEPFILALLIILVYLCIYGIVDRICRCVENTAMAKAYGSYLSMGVNVKPDTVAESIKKATDAMKKLSQGIKDVKEDQNNN